MTNDEIISLVLNAFSPISAIHTDGAAADTDTVLFVVPDSNNNLVGGKMPASVLRAYLTKALNPTINSSGYWVIGSTVTTIKAEGVTPLIRRGANGIEASTDKGATYNTVALWSDLRPDFAGMSAEEKAAFKFNYSDFTAEEIAALQKPATDAAALVTDHITLCDAAKDAANTAAASANAAATLATTQGNRCKAFADNPIKIQSGTWWVWDEASSAYQDTGVSPANYVLTKSEVERVLTGAITSHNHDTEYLRKTAISEINANTANIATNTADIAELKLGTGKYYIGSWNPDDLSPVPSARFGDQTWARNLSGIYLFDMTLNTKETMTPVGELQRANWLRFTDGTFAPVVGITEAMRATCDVALYLDNTQTTLYSAAGAFNATVFYNTYGMSQKLYDGSGNEVRILRPWETVETKYHIGFAFREKVWLIDGLGDSGKYHEGLSQHDISWDGVKGVPLEKTAFSPGPTTSVGNKMRNFFFVYNTGDSNTVSRSGQNGLCTLFSGLNRQFPRVSDVNQITNMNYARANNPTATNPYPVAEGGYHTLNSIISRAEVLYNTRYLHNPSLFGSGISSNDICNSEATFLANGGFKYKKSADSTYSYCTLGATPTMYYNTSAGTANASDWLNGQYPKEQCLESQMAASFAKETGVAQNTNFSFYGNTYQYRNVTGVLGLADGYMNVIVTKVLSQTVSAFDNVGTATNYDISCCLRMSVVDGMNLSGDIFEYVGGGYEQVGTNISTVSSHYGDTIDLYIQPDQKKWHNDSTVSKNDLGIFDFEKSYTKVGTFVTIGNNYSKKRNPLTPFKVLNGGNMATGMCYYQYENNYWSAIINQRVRISARFRGCASISDCSARFLYATHAVSSAYVFHGWSAQILMP